MTTRHHLVSVAKLINPCILDLDLDLVLDAEWQKMDGATDNKRPKETLK